MKIVWTARVNQAAARYGDHAPMAAACCNVCRTCVQTNVLGLAIAGIVGGAATVTRIFLRRPRTAPSARTSSSAEARAKNARNPTSAVADVAMRMFAASRAAGHLTL